MSSIRLKLFAASVALFATLTTLAQDPLEKPDETGFIAMVQPKLESVGPDPARCPDASHPVAFRLRGTAQTPLGNATVVESHCEDPGSTSFRRGEYVITLASGESLTGVYAGRILRTPTTASDGVLVIDGRYRHTGGTGPFERARGSGLSVGTVNARNGSVMITMGGAL